MKRKQTFSILVWAYRGKNKESQATLYARVTVNGKRAEISLGRKVTLDQWDESACKVNGNTAEAEQLNEFLDIAKAELHQIRLMLKATGEEVTAVAIKNKYLGVEEEKKSLLEVFKAYNATEKELIDKEKGRIAIGTYKRLLVAYGKLERFIKTTYKKPDVFLHELNYKFITDYEFFLKVTDNLEHNTCRGHLKILKKIATLCVNNAWLDRNPFAAFKYIALDVDRQILNTQQLETLINKPLPSKRLEEVRDVFVFSCFTGYAYSDVHKLTLDHVGTGIDGERWIFLNRTKTHNRSNIPLLPIALQLTEKYKDHPACVVKGKLFPVSSNQKYNDYLKEIAAICGFNIKLTTHIARHTFATTVALVNGVPLETVSAILGHKSIRTTQIYAKIVQEKLSIDMQSLRGKLSTSMPKAVEAPTKTEESTTNSTVAA
ncbi:site-specific integrase [Fulvivirgaceae bacterium PWU5]|uniref:Site-specific integrase n=1 Tax=Dawidia cretensis TaxID=2782350 RepID=A0AAP2E2T4_9BACT|nr:site-specific integrase [Dawidia cretensis]MBT1712028.1 site-specific integrase [Dawidia cretensis]